MKRILTSQLIPGMVTAEDVLSFQNQLILNKGTVLTDSLITKLDLYGIITIYVEQPFPMPPAVDDSSYFSRLKKSEEYQEFKADYEINIDTFRNSINQVVERNITLDVDMLLQSTMDMISGQHKQLDILSMLQNMREYDDSTFSHSLNVALICNVLASWLRWDKEDVKLATGCGLFHDVGKLLVPHDIIAKPGKLSVQEYKEVQKHPYAGYRLLKSQHIDEHICNAAMMHHERCDGSGYPLHLHGNKIDRFAKIVAIADVYDAMTAARVYRGPLCPFKVIEILEDEGLQKYEVKYILTFLENVVNTYIQTHCQLNDKRRGDIIYINKDKLSRPIVLCGTEYVNLAEYPDLSIECLL